MKLSVSLGSASWIVDCIDERLNAATMTFSVKDDMLTCPSYYQQNMFTSLDLPASHPRFHVLKCSPYMLLSFVSLNCLTRFPFILKLEPKHEQTVISSDAAENEKCSRQ